MPAGSQGLRGTEEAINNLDCTNDKHLNRNRSRRLREIAAAAHFAEESPVRTEASIFEDVYFEVDRQTEAGRTGRFFFND